MAKSDGKKKLQKPPNKTDVQSNERPWSTIIGLGLGAIIMYALVWIGALHSGETIAEFYAKDHARDWTSAVVENFTAKQDVFGPQGLRINDKYTLQDFQKGTNIYRYSLVNENGRVFESSKIDEKGKLEKRAFFYEQVKNGKIVATRSTVQAKQLDGYTMQTHISAIDENSIRQVIEIAVPVVKDNKFVGAFFILDDITNLLLWSDKQARNIALILCAAVTLIFLAIASMVWSYGSSRIKQNNALKAATLDAEKAEKAARQMADQLQVMNDDIGTLNSDLNNNMKILRDTQNEVIRKGKMAQLGQLTATVAHDIRNPLGSIRTSAFLLRRKFSSENPTMEKPLTRIEKGVERCDGIITQLLDFARSKDMNLKQKNLDEWLINLLREQSEHLPQEVSFEVTLGLGNQEYAFDADNLARAVINFLTNASEAMVGKGNDRPVEITQDPTIFIATSLTDRGVEISVSDNGPGISSKNLEKIMDPLFTTKSFGVGLGLPAVEKIFEQHDGGLEVQSEEGHGAKFTGWIAIAEPDTQAKDAKAA